MGGGVVACAPIGAAEWAPQGEAMSRKVFEFLRRHHAFVMVLVLYAETYRGGC